MPSPALPPMPLPLLTGSGAAGGPTPGTSPLTPLLHATAHAAARLANGRSSVEPVAFPIITPVMHWLGGQAAKVVGDVWKAAMTGLWSAALWLLQLAFHVIDTFTTPDLSGTGPMGAILPTTLWIGAAVAVLMMFVQLAVTLLRRDGQSLGRLVLGIVQFGAVWLAYLGVGAGLVAAAAGLERGILSATLHVSAFSGINLSASWPRNVNDVVLATVLGVLSLLLVIPAAFFYVVIMFVRAAALIILLATAPIAAGGLLAEASKVWFWKTLRWFIACLLISPLCALVLGIGVQLSQGVVSGQGDKTAAAAGMAVVGCVVIAIGACCPLVLFRLLAFVDPTSTSGAALRESWSDAGGMTGLLSGKAAASTGSGGGSDAAARTGGDGRAAGESNADSTTTSRLSSAMGAAGWGIGAAMSAAHKAADLSADVLGAAGIGHPGYSLTYADTRANQRRAANTESGQGRGGGGSGGQSGDGAGPTPPGNGGGGPDGDPTGGDPTGGGPTSPVDPTGLSGPDGLPLPTVTPELTPGAAPAHGGPAPAGATGEAAGDAGAAAAL